MGKKIINNKKAQITIFVIVGILIVVAVILLFWLFQRTGPQIQPTASKDPKRFLEQCVNEHVEQAANKIFENSGYIEQSELTKKYKGEDIAYLCYTPINYARCIIIEPVLIEHIETEIYNYVEPKIKECFINLKQELINEKYSVNLGSNTEFSIELIPGTIKTTINRKLTVSKTDETRKFENYESNLQNPLYDTFILIQEIVAQEALYCNSERSKLMRLNPDFEIIREQPGDDTKVYTVTALKINKIIKFAIRGCVLGTPS